MKEDNLTIHKGHIEVIYNAKIYPLSAIFAAAYILTDKAYIIIDGDIKKELVVIIRPKDQMDLKKLAYEFNDQVTNYIVYEKQADRSKVIREQILKRALITGLRRDMIEGKKKKVKKEKKQDNEKDKKEILIPWEKKFGK